MNFIKKIPVITRSLILLNLIMYFITPLIPDSDLHMMVAYGPQSDHFNLIQPLTSMFLHGGFTHIFFNMLLLWMFGRSVELEAGQKKFLLFYLFAGIGGYLLQGIFYPDNPAIGASGAVFGVVMGMAVLFPNQKVNLFFLPFLSFKLKWIMGIYFGFEVYNAIHGLAYGVGDGVAHLAHVGGGLVGMALAGFWITNKFKLALQNVRK
ncbi:MAG: Rhomboid protease GluP [uncultured marine phage]|uniref:Rhomboid protease GluP n=1 Tax=uncultured marine phage TaxID=707152 RepID=A0A8D9FS43_9VIRU|nr:MAG: Rhomboid protease GluP [uncultured marine phage]